MKYEIKDAAELMMQECQVAMNMFGPFNSAHEGYAVILEEMDELWEKIKSKSSTPDEICEEAIQVGAMAMRFIVDLIAAYAPLLSTENGKGKTGG
jgi:uncharacterized phage protein gp47/JayE